MKLEGKIVVFLAKISPSLYSRYSTIEKVRKMMYVKLKKALYGTLQAAFLFWKNLTSALIEWGFTINPYYWCVANKMVDSHQITIVWFHPHRLRQPDDRSMKGQWWPRSYIAPWWYTGAGKENTNGTMWLRTTHNTWQVYFGVYTKIMQWSSHKTSWSQFNLKSFSWSRRCWKYKSPNGTN